jgi:hypothetical protein
MVPLLMQELDSEACTTLDSGSTHLIELSDHWRVRLLCIEQSIYHKARSHNEYSQPSAVSNCMDHNSAVLPAHYS